MDDQSHSLSLRDQRVIWHPYSQHGLQQEILPVVSAKGAYLKLEDGREILDAISSWWVNIHGHAHPRIVRAIEAQASKMEHVIFAGFTHEPAVRLAEMLVEYPSIRDAGLSRVFYSDNGSTAVEVAMKMAYQYHYNLGSRKHCRFIALKNSYHGDTLGAMAVGEPSGFHQPFRKLMPEVDFVEVDQIEELESLINRFPGEHAAFIFEPLVQGAAGMKMYDPIYLQDAVALCRSKNILTICDEVFTGFYRTGKCFAFEHTNIQPDLVCLSKGITGGFLPMSVTLASERIFSAFLSQDIATAFLHGHSYTANPVACSAAIESWKMLQEPECLARIEMITALTRRKIERLQSHPKVKQARCLGTIGAVEMKNDLTYFSHKPSSIMKRALSQNILLRPLGNVLYAVPPYCCTENEIESIYALIEELMSVSV